MKKILIVVLAAAIVLAICFAAQANESAANAYDSVAKLLFEENNVSLSVNAEFSLDGVWFKTVEGTWKQDGNRSLRELKLTSPKQDGGQRHNGYTIATEGNDLYLMEVYSPGVYRTGGTSERTTILRNTVEASQLVKLGHALASQAELLLGQDAVTGTDREIRINLGPDAPELVNAALNQAYNFAVKRWFDQDNDDFAMERESAGIDQYGTVTQGILFCTRGLVLREARLTLSLDGEGYPIRAEGSAGITLETSDEEQHRLDITFKAEAADRGNTVLKPFHPEDYGVVRADGDYEGGEYGERQPIGTEPEKASMTGDDALKDEMMIDAMQRWSFTGYNMIASTNVECNWTGYFYEVRIYGGDNGVVKTAQYSEDGVFWGMELTPAAWLDGMDGDDEYDFIRGLDPETDQKAKEFMLQFLRDNHYAEADQVKDLQIQWTFEKNGNKYACYEDRTDPEANGVAFVMKVNGEMWIEQYAEVSNG